MNLPTLEDHQETAVGFLVVRKRALIQSPAGSGKTFMAAAAIRRVLERKARTNRVRVGWMANTLEQLQQGRAALEAFGLLDLIELTIECPAGMPKGAEFDILIVDEAHHGPAESWAEIINAHRSALWCFTATPFGDDEERNNILRAMVNDQIHVVPRSAVASRVVHGAVQILDDTNENMRGDIDLAIDDELVPMTRRVLYMKWPEYWAKVFPEFRERHSIAAADPMQAWAGVQQVPKLKEAAKEALNKACRNDLWPRVAYRKCLDLGIALNDRRNSAILRLADKHAADMVLILVNTVTHGQSLADKIPGAVVCHSKMGNKARKKAMEDFKAGTLRCMIATSLADEGLDLPMANVLILAGAGRSSAKTEQRTGRVLRTFGDKTHGVIYDFSDQQHPLLANQARKRQALYRQLGYSIEKPTAQRSLFSSLT